MITKAIGIIGNGPRGLNVIERLIAFGRNEPDCYIEVHLFDRHLPGAGVHDVNQPSHLLLNTVACQVTQFSDDSLRDGGPTLAGPSFLEWMMEQGPPAGSDSVDFNAYYPRRTFGAYLNWSFNYLCRLAPTHVRIIQHRIFAKRVSRLADDRWRLTTEEGEQEVDYLFLTTGHSRKLPGADEQSLISQVRQAHIAKPSLAYIPDPYPLRRRLGTIEAPQVVAVEGAGLTAFDIMSELTIGRGGRFHRDGQRLVYQPSGAEPQKILLFCRSGLPLTARGINEKGIHGQYKARFLTVERIGKLRKQSPDRQLDFQQDVLPLLLLDMQHAYYFALLKEQQGMIEAMQFSNDFAHARDEESRQELLNANVAPEDRFDWKCLVQPIPEAALCGPREYKTWLLDHLGEDVRQAELGNVTSPVKAACDVLRDLRDNLRLAIDFAGLNQESHRWFLECFVPLMNRLAVGPPKSRVEELIALIEAGIVQFDFGPRAKWCFTPERQQFVVHSTTFPGYTRCADVLVRARIAMPRPCEDTSPLMKQLLRDGLVRPFMNGDFETGGIEVDRNLNVVDRAGLTLPTLWSLGTPTEGCRFYTYVVPRPGVNSSAIVDAGRAVGNLYQHIRDKNTIESQLSIPITLNSLSGKTSRGARKTEDVS